MSTTRVRIDPDDAEILLPGRIDHAVLDGTTDPNHRGGLESHTRRTDGALPASARLRVNGQKVP